MKRPMLISSIAMALICAFLMLFSNIAAVVTALISVSVFIVYFIKPFKLRKYIAIPTVCVCALIICASFLSYNALKIEPCLQYDNKICYISGKVITSPKTEYGYTTFTVKTENIADSRVPLKIDVTLPQSKAENVKLYDFISIEKAKLTVAKNESNRLDTSKASSGVILSADGNGASVLWHSERDPYYYCLRFKESVSQKITDFTEHGTGGLLKGMLFGDSTDIEEDTLSAFRNSGIAHLLAVSGLHTSLWCGLLISLLKLLKVSEKIRNTVCLVFLAGFCTVSAFTPSVLRASLMMSIILIAPFFKRRPDALNSLGFAVTVLLLFNPYIITSISFQLSASSTLGVLLASSYETLIYKYTSKLKFKLLKRFADYILTSFLISIAAGLFTLPISAYHFNVFSIISPLTNIFCVKLAFYGMLSGTFATVLAFLNVGFIKSITIFVFDISEFILNAVVYISKTFSSFKYCTLPVNRTWLVYGIIVGAVIISVGFLIKKLKHSKTVFKISVLLAVVALFINISVPVLPTKYGNTLTVVSAGDNLHLVLRSGTHYMYIVNAQDPTPFYDIYGYLPKATCETLDYCLVTYLSYNAVSDLEKTARTLSPTETHVTPSVKQIAEKMNVTLPENTVIPTTGKYLLNGEIDVEIVDTTPMQYVIIKGKEKTVYVHLHGSTKFDDVIDTSQTDIFIYNGASPEQIPQSAETVIINSDSEIITDANYSESVKSGYNIFLTAQNGDIQFTV